MKSSINQNNDILEIGTNNNPIITSKTVYGKFIFLLKMYAKEQITNKIKNDSVCDKKNNSCIKMVLILNF
ncbi:MAG: hypothetical protein Q8S84_06915 [bacterium]|nr:hypothetical protein [bacterium]MDP3381189.1 hypothetical protein [bacterium]